MALQPLDLPAPDVMRPRWAAASAVLTGIGYGRGCFATVDRWHYDDAGGNRADLVFVGGGRAVLLGHDHEFSETYFRDAATYFDEPETDLLADAPDWWATPLQDRDPTEWVGFVYGWDGSAWQRADYELDDGFRSVGLPAVSEADVTELVTTFVAGAAKRQGLAFTPDSGAIAGLLAAGPAVTPARLAAVFGPVDADVGAGVAAAGQFR